MRNILFEMCEEDVESVMHAATICHLTKSMSEDDLTKILGFPMDYAKCIASCKKLCEGLLETLIKEGKVKP